MFRKAFVKLTGIFLFCISATSATPSGRPREVQNINDERAVQYNPSSSYIPYQCEDPFVWVRRECVAANGPMAWQDVCRWNSFVVLYDYKPGSCPVDNTCMDSFNAQGNFITCLSNKTGLPISKGKSDPQIGKSDVKSGRTQLGNTQQQYSVTVDHDMTAA